MTGVAQTADAADGRPNALTVDLDAIRDNLRLIRSGMDEGFTVVASLKANAYGFGLLGVVEAVLAGGANAVAVASVDDAIALRSSGVRVPILLYGGARPGPRVIADVVANDLTVSILDEADVRAFASAGARVRALVKVDVGLERLGGVPDEAVAVARLVHQEPGLDLAGLYTHLHVPAGPLEEISAYLGWQFRCFVAAVAELEAEGIPVPLRIAASSATLRLTDAMHLNGIDVGSVVYGVDTAGPVSREVGIRSALVGITSRLTQVRPRERTEFPRQSPIPTGRPMELGVIPFGASDGLLGISTGAVLIRGRRAPILSISLEHARLDVTGIGAVAGDEVVIVGRQGGDEISMRDVASANHLHSPGVVPALVGRAVPRRYVGG